VLQLVAHGLTTAEIAVQLGLSPLTVNVHLRAIYRKFRVNSRTAAAHVAHTLQLV
jgi:DNA-binding CsgD family transcriptional regulator